MIIDLHTHTYPRSGDSLLNPDVLIQEAKKLGLDGICLTEHDEFWDVENPKGRFRPVMLKKRERALISGEVGPGFLHWV